MTGTQWAVLGIGGAILVYPTWCLLKEIFWAVVLELFPEQPDALDEKAETYGPVVKYGPIDDTMAIAEAVGVARLDAGLLIDWHNRQVALSDASLEQTLNGWSYAAGGVALLLDHAACEGQCGRTLCLCLVRCPAFVTQACSHHVLVCDECRLICADCRIDYLDDAGVLG